MKKNILILLCLLSLDTYSQNRSATRRSTRTISTKDFIGTWKLTKLADIHLRYLPDSVKKEILRFTKDSVFVTFEKENYSGTWKLVGSQPIITIKATKQYNYKWLAGSTDTKFFTTKGLGYYKYFVRVNKI
ncbi:MAG: hypothetical protein JWO92_428 [Chitinophagaceae bacterium]|nr:hypothetical protein [Chitinophagaceae bacterium]